MKRFLSAVAVWGGLLLPHPAQSAELDLEFLIDEALAQNPEIEALRLRVAVFDARIPQAGAPDDPILRLEASNVPVSRLDFNSTPMPGKQISLSQRLPFPGVLRARTEEAKHAADKAGADLEDREVFITNRVRRAYYDLAFTSHAREVVSRNVRLLESLIEITLSKYALGQGRQQDVLQAQVSLAKLRIKALEFETGELTAKARLNVLLNRSPRSDLAAPGRVMTGSPAHTVEGLEAMADRHRPLLRGLGSTASQWRSAEIVAQKEGLPDFTLGISYRQRDFMPFDPVTGEDFISVAVGIRLPLFRGRKQKQKAAEARANLRWVEKRIESERLRIHFEIHRISLELDQHHKEHLLFETSVLPQAEQSLKSARSSYQVGLAEFDTVLNAQTTLFDAELMSYHHAVMHAKLSADLDAVVGTRVRAKQLHY